MSLLFTIENKIVKPHVETLLISPFREIWERDTHPGKFTAIDEFTYMEFMTSVLKSNPYAGYTESVRKEKINLQIMKHEAYEPDELVIEGMQWLVNFQKDCSHTYNYYMSAKKAAEKMQNFFETYEMSDVNPKTGLPLWKPRDITAALNDTSKVLQTLSDLKAKVENDVYEVVKNKGQKKTSVFSNPDTL